MARSLLGSEKEWRGRLGSFLCSPNAHTGSIVFLDRRCSSNARSWKQPSLPLKETVSWEHHFEKATPRSTPPETGTGSCLCMAVADHHVIPKYEERDNQQARKEHHKVPEGAS